MGVFGVEPIRRQKVAGFPVRYRELRALWFASFFAGGAYIAETVVLGWLLLDRTDSPFVVSLGVALRASPNFLFGLLGGAITDRFDRRLVLRLAGFALAADAGLLGGLAFSGHLFVWLLLLLTFVSGAIRSLSQMARQ